MPGLNESYQEGGFLRQRRNLIVGSVALLFVQVADLQLQPHGSVMGLPFTIGRPEALNWFLWTAVLYWFVRFYQFHQFRRPTHMQEAARQLMFQLFLPHALTRVTPPLSQEAPELKPGESAEMVARNFSLSDFEFLQISASVEPAWLIRGPNGERTIRGFGGERRIVFDGLLMWRIRVWAYVKAAFATPAFTEYTLPYIVFLLPVVYAGYRLLN